MNLINKLESIGLTKQESTVYLALVQLQEAKTGKLCSFTSIASSNIYKVLDSLLKNGLVSYRIDNNIKVFYPSPVERLNDLLLEKQKKFDEERKQITELISNLKKVEEDRLPQSNYKFYEGIGGVISMWYEITQNMQKDSECFIFASKIEGYKKMIPYYDEFHKVRVARNVKSKIILPFEDKQLAIQRRKELAEVRFYHLENEAEIGVVGDYVYIQYVMQKNPRSFLIKDRVLSASFMFLLNQLWIICKD